MAEDNSLIGKIEGFKDRIRGGAEISEKKEEKKIETLPTPETESGADSQRRQEIAEMVAKTREGEGQLGAGPYGGATPAFKARQKKIEVILEKDLGDIFAGMTPEKQKEFKLVGEETAAKINELIGRGKVKVKKIIDLIRKWLSLVPGVNKFFLEQEAKIKADEIIKNTRHETDFRL
ncbi:MAG: hypothetical protein V1867_08330 [Candidatus Falkowbacteria bacterium]